MASTGARAYNSVWQFRADAWCRLEEVSDRLARALATGKPTDQLASKVETLLAELAPFEHYWAFPGPQLFAQSQRLFTTGAYDKFARTVANINRALVTESYRSGDAGAVLAGNHETSEASAPYQDVTPEQRSERPYFEVLVVETMTESQERALRKEVRSWRRPDDSSSTSWSSSAAVTRPSSPRGST